MAKKFTITQTLPSVQIWVFEVVADSEEAALEMIENGDTDPVDYFVDDDGFHGVEIVVTDIEEVEDGEED